MPLFAARIQPVTCPGSEVRCASTCHDAMHVICVHGGSALPASGIVKAVQGCRLACGVWQLFASVVVAAGRRESKGGICRTERYLSETSVQ